jgi:hypothetical protein
LLAALVVVGGLEVRRATLSGQEPAGTVAVVCAPCAGEDFGFAGPGMVLMQLQSGSYELWFYSLDKGEASLPNFNVRAVPQTAPRLIGRLRVGAPLLWAPK